MQGKRVMTRPSEVVQLLLYPLPHTIFQQIVFPNFATQHDYDHDHNHDTCKL